MESLTGIARAGAGPILTYFAIRAARRLERRVTASETLLHRARAVMPGGVDSPVRAFGAVGGNPPFIASAHGSVVTTVDGDELVDFIASWGALILGHADGEVVAAVRDAAGRGTSFGVSTSAEVELAEAIVFMVPSVEMVRMVNSGTEATASAIRLARAVTGRPAIVKFEGCYHGHADPFLVARRQRAGHLRRAGQPRRAGRRRRRRTGGPVQRPRLGGTGARRRGRGRRHRGAGRREHGRRAARVGIPRGVAVAVRPARGTARVRRGDDRLPGRPGGAQERYEVTPDLTCLGKVVAGGTPAAAYGGGADLMRRMAPDGPVYQAGTLAGNPVVTAAGLATLRRIAADAGLHDRLEAMGATIERRLAAALAEHGVAGCVQRVGSMVTLFLGPEQVTSWDDATRVDRERFARVLPRRLRPWSAAPTLAVRGLVPDGRPCRHPRPGGRRPGGGDRDADVTSPLVAALHRRPVDRTPVWAMRQAGRYLPEYRDLRLRHDFQTAVSTPEIAVEITLQPIRRFAMDGAVIFADIMTPLEAMGVPMTFDPGPRLRPHTVGEVATLGELDVARVAHVTATVAGVRALRSLQRPRIGFAGAPVTLLAYLLEGGGSNGFPALRAAVHRDPAGVTEALGVLASAMRRYLEAQAAAGADVVQLFDTWAGVLDRAAIAAVAVPAARPAWTG